MEFNVDYVEKASCRDGRGGDGQIFNLCAS